MREGCFGAHYGEREDCRLHRKKPERMESHPVHAADPTGAQSDSASGAEAGTAGKITRERDEEARCDS